MIPILGLSEFATALVAVIVGVLASGRVVRLVVSDTFPLSVHLRVWWDRVTRRGADDESLWNPLLHCPWCFAPYVTLLNLAAFLLANDAGGLWFTFWWLLNGWLAAAYATSWVVFHDED